MRIQVYRDKERPEDGYVVRQKVRIDQEGKTYETRQVGFGTKLETPDGEPYIDITIEGLTNNSHEYGD